MATSATSARSARAMANSWADARPFIITALAKAIDKKTRNARRWIPLPDLIPADVAPRKFSSVFKKGLEPYYGGSFLCALVKESTGLIMVRHRFSDVQYLWVENKAECKDPKSAILDAIRIGPRGAARNSAIAEEFHDECEDDLVELCGMQQARGPEMSATTPNVTRRQERKEQVVSAPSPAERMVTFKSHGEREQRQILDDLAADSKEKGELEAALERIDGEPAAADLINFMMSQDDEDDGAPMKLIQSILARPSVKSTGEMFPRTNSFADAGERNQSNAIRILNALVNKCAKLLLPKDDANGRALLINAMIKSATFRKYSVPSRKTEAALKYRQFASLPAVQAVKLAIKTLGKSDEALRAQLLSLLDDYPRRWVKKLTGVGTITLKKAKWHAAVVGPGLTDKMAPALRRDRRSGPVENHFAAWLAEATIVLPNVNKDSNGQYKSEPITHLRQNRYQAIKSYQKDFSLAKSDGRFDLNDDHSAYGLRHLYQRFKEMNLREAPEEHAVCSHCHKNNGNWNKTIEAIDFLFATDGERRRDLTAKVERYRAYFMSGGEFSVQLQVTSTCRDHCCRFALSSLDDADFRELCDDHEHTHGDTMVEEVYDLYNILREKWRDLYRTSNFHCSHDGDAVKAVWIRGDEALIRDENDEEFTVSWDELDGLQPSQVNTLLLGDLIDVMEDRFTSHLGHLYCDRVQTHGKNKICANKKNVMIADYLMKMRAKKRVSDQSEWHVLQVKGSSVHIACLEHQLDQEEINKLVAANLISTDKVEEKDLVQTHVIAIGSDTTQGGYETLCTLIATIARYEKEDPGIFDEEGLYMISDAGSGYRTKENIVGLRGKKVLGYLFSCPGHGKTEQCDGKGPQLKSQRERAMRAGDPADCTTPRREVLAQRHGGGLPGTITELIEISQEGRMDMSQWDGLMGFLYFEYLPDGGIRAWRHYGIGPGKTFSKAWLDSLYAGQEGEEDEGDGGESNDDGGYDSDETVEEYEDPVDGETRYWHRWSIQHKGERIAKRDLDRPDVIHLATAIGSGWKGNTRKMTVRFDERIVDYDSDDDNNDDEKIADGYTEDMDEKELRTNFALYKSEGIRLEPSSSTGAAREPRSASRNDEGTSSMTVAQSSALSYPQVETGGRFVEVKAGDYGPDPSDDEESNDGRKPRDVKVMPSKKRRKLAKSERAERVEEKRRLRLEKRLAEEKKRDDAAAQLWPHKCEDCQRRFASEKFMQRHTCRPPREVSGSVVVGRNASSYANRDGSGRMDSTLHFENVVPLDSRQWRPLLMGHGLGRGREANPINPAARKILVDCFDLGEERGGGARMSPYEMQQACLLVLPSLICPEIPEIQRFITDEVKNRGANDGGGDNENDNADGDGATITKKKLTRFEKEQKKSDTLGRDLYKKRSENSDLVGMRFEKKYKGKCLMRTKDSGDVRIVTDIKYSLQQQCWYAETKEAEMDDIDDRKYILTDSNAVLNVFIGYGSNNLGKYIKQYNQWAGLRK